MQDEPTQAPPDRRPTPGVAAGQELPTGNATSVPANPAWAKDLRKLYNAVVEEPLPDNLIALLSQLDAED